MSVDLVSARFSQLAQIVEGYEQNQIDGALLKRTLQFCEQLQQNFVTSADVFVAQPLLFKRRFTYSHNLTFNTLIYVMLICHRNHVNDTTARQLLAGIISLYGQNKISLSAFFEHGEPPEISAQNSRTTQLLKRADLRIWSHVCRLSHALYFEPAKIALEKLSLSFEHQIIMQAHCLSILVTHRANKRSMSFASALKLLFQMSSHRWLQTLRPLLEYPTLLCPGSLFKLHNNHSMIVLSAKQDKIFAFALKGNDQDLCKQTKLYAPAITHTLPSQKITGFRQVALWYDTRWSALADEFKVEQNTKSPIDKPPVALLAVQKHLLEKDIDIEKLATLISEEPAFEVYVKRTASMSNRSKLPVQYVKHGLMMHGYERTNNLLIEHALLLRLNQQYFPLQQQCTEFVKVVAAIASLLAAKSHYLPPEQASNLLYFACAGLFTQTNVKNQIDWQRQTSKLFLLEHLIKTPSSANMKKHASILIKTWQQPQLFEFAVKEHSTLPDQMKGPELNRYCAVLLGVCLIIGRQIYFVDEQQCRDTQRYLAQSYDVLDITSDALSELHESVAGSTHCYSKME